MYLQVTEDHVRAEDVGHGLKEYVCLRVQESTYIFV